MNFFTATFHNGKNCKAKVISFPAAKRNTYRESVVKGASISAPATPVGIFIIFNTIDYHVGLFATGVRTFVVCFSI